MHINCYKDRQGNIHEKQVLSEDAIKFLYDSFPGRCALKVLASHTCSNVMRLFLNSSASALLIDSFIKKNGISLKDYVPCVYSCFNEFFSRHILPERRKLAEGKNVLSTPADGRVSVFEISEDSVFQIKNSDYSVRTLLRSKRLAEYYKGGYFVLIRLAVDNYHRYSYAFTGKKSGDREIDGFLHTVNPLAFDYVNVYTENARTYTNIKADNGKLYTQMEVGAMGVGRITNHEKAEAWVKRGDEKGYFEFGGSSVILLLPKNGAIIDKDLIENSRQGYETMVQMGEKIGSLC